MPQFIERNVETVLGEKGRQVVKQHTVKERLAQHLAVITANELLLILSVQVDAGLAKGAKVEGDVAQVAKVVMGRQLRCQKGYAFHNLVVRHPPILWQSGGVLSCALIIGTAIARKVAKAAKRNTKATEARKRNKCFS